MLSQISSKINQLPFGTRLLLICTGLYCVAVALLMLTVYSQWSSTIEHQADAIGQTIARQTANEAVVALAAEDTLGLGVLLRQLNNNPYINYSVLYSADNQIIADAGKASDSASHSRTYSQQLSFQRVLAGNLQIQIDIRQLQQPMHKSLQSIALIAALILVAALFLLQLSIKKIRRNLLELNNWLFQPTSAVPFQQQQDEIGLLARSLHQLLAPPLLQEVVEEQADKQQETAPELSEEEDTVDTPDVAENPDSEVAQPDSQTEQQPVIAQPQTRKVIVLAVQMNFEQAFGQLAENRQQSLLDKYQQAVRRCAELFQASLEPQKDRRNLLLFSSQNQHFVRYAICAGELLRALAHQLQIEVADSCCTVSMQLALVKGEIELDNWHESQPATQAVELSNYSRNLLLLCEGLAHDGRSLSCARLRAIARPANTNCVEQLLTPYLTQLDSQLKIITQPSSSQV